MKKKLVRYLKRAFALVVPWILVRILVNGLNYLLGLLDPGWLVIVLMALMDEAAPPVAAFFALGYQFYKELEEDGELEHVLGHKPSRSALESSCSGSSQHPDNTDIVISSESDLEDFLSSHTLVDTIHTKVVGVSFPNEDGTSRQGIIRLCNAGDPVQFEFWEYKGSPAYAVFSEHGQIGNLPSELASSIDENYDSCVLHGTIDKITGGSEELFYGCNLMINVYRENKPESIPSTLSVPDTPKLSQFSNVYVDSKTIDYSMLKPKNNQNDIINFDFIAEAQWHAARKAEKHENQE